MSKYIFERLNFFGKLPKFSDFFFKNEYISMKNKLKMHPSLGAVHNYQHFHKRTKRTPFLTPLPPSLKAYIIIINVDSKIPLIFLSERGVSKWRGVSPLSYPFSPFSHPLAPSSLSPFFFSIFLHPFHLYPSLSFHPPLLFFLPFSPNF